MFKVYLDLYEKGYYITPGGKFGADFILYEDDPLKIHGFALVFVRET